MSWGGADLTTECYIGRVSLGTTADDIKAHIISCGVDVIRLEENNMRHNLFKSFKLIVKKIHFDDLLKPGVWPEGVLFRRFYNPRSPTDAGRNESLLQS